MAGLVRPLPTVGLGGTALACKQRRGASLSIGGRRGPVSVSARAGARLVGEFPQPETLGSVMPSRLQRGSARAVSHASIAGCLDAL